MPGRGSLRIIPACGVAIVYVETNELQSAISDEPLQKEIAGQKLADILEQHEKWVESHGEEGEQADLSRAELMGADLSGVNLQGAMLRKANLKGADLLLADLQGTCLMQANLQGANLLGTDLREADLQGATLEGATGLLVSKLAGSNLFGALLPEPISSFGGMEFVGQTSQGARRLFATILLLSATVSLIIGATTDVQLLKNSASLPLSHVGDAIPMVGFYLFLPVLLFGLYLYFHFYMQRLWDGLAQFPAIFPDGRALDQTVPWLLTGLVRRHFKWLRINRPAISFLKIVIAMLLAYWVVPATLLLFWARYLARQDLRGTILHVLLVGAGVASALFLPHFVGRVLPAPNPQPQHQRRTRIRGAIVLGVCATLSFLSLGSIYGVPHDRGPERRAIDIRCWAANALWVVGYNPYPDLTEVDISTKPKNWTGRDDELALVKGARLSKLRLRYAEAYRSFLVNARLWRSDLEGANLSEADLRGADLHQANLQSTVLDRARITRASLQGANLRRANLTRADLREADLSFASLVGAILNDAKLDGATLYKANLRGALLLRPNLEKADLREAILEDANLTSADLSEAHLSSAKLMRAGLRDAQLQHAILIEADLRGTDLRSADLQGAVLRGAELGGANLDGADLREAKGLSAVQICSAAGRRGIQLDQDLQSQVDAQCGTTK